MLIGGRADTTLVRAEAEYALVEGLFSLKGPDKEAVNELFRDVSGKISERPGGYTRIIKIGNRLGDGADMCIIELVDYNENLLSDNDINIKIRGFYSYCVCFNNIISFLSH